MARVRRTQTDSVCVVCYRICFWLAGWLADWLGSLVGCFALLCLYDMYVCTVRIHGSHSCETKRERVRVRVSLTVCRARSNEYVTHNSR